LTAAAAGVGLQASAPGPATGFAEADPAEKQAAARKGHAKSCKQLRQRVKSSGGLGDRGESSLSLTPQYSPQNPDSLCAKACQQDGQAVRP
jgi:hypothetical protein